MFVRLRIGEQKGPPPEFLHKWVKEADRMSRMYRANPARPQVMSLDGQLLRRIEECDPGSLVRGDAVAITFSVSYIEGTKDWYPTFTLIDIVRVASDHPTWRASKLDNMVVLNDVRPPLAEGQQVIGKFCKAIIISFALRLSRHHPRRQ